MLQWGCRVEHDLPLKNSKVSELIAEKFNTWKSKASLCISSDYLELSTAQNHSNGQLLLGEEMQSTSIYSDTYTDERAIRLAGWLGPGRVARTHTWSDEPVATTAHVASLATGAVGGTLSTGGAWGSVRGRQGRGTQLWGSVLREGGEAGAWSGHWPRAWGRAGRLGREAGTGLGAWAATCVGEQRSVLQKYRLSPHWSIRSASLWASCLTAQVHRNNNN